MADAFNVPVCPHFLIEPRLPLCCAVPDSRWLEFIPQLDRVTHMAVTAEIKTGTRRIIDYILSPVMRYQHESLRER